MEIKDLAGFSDPLKKLITVISQGVGAVTKPYLTRKNADADAYRIRHLTDAMKYAQEQLGKADYINGEIVLQSTEPSALLLPERTASRADYQAAKEQLNIEDITSIAAEELANEEAVSQEPVDPDWVTRFFDMARHVSQEQMQILWGKILAGEIKQPNSFSLRTLELLRNLSQREAEIFVKCAKLAIRAEGVAPFLLYEDVDQQYMVENYSITFLDLLLMEELGLLTRQLGIKFSDSSEQNDKLIVDSLICSNSILVLEREVTDGTLTFNILNFTTVGSELLRLIVSPHDILYVRRVALKLKDGRESRKVKIAQIQRIEAGKIIRDDFVEVRDDKGIDVSSDNLT